MLNDTFKLITSKFFISYSMCVFVHVNYIKVFYLIQYVDVCVLVDYI